VIEFYPVEIIVDKGPAVTGTNGPALTGWCTKEGHASVLFFTHGNGFSSRTYQPMLELLAQKYDLLMLDIPGHGRSPNYEFVGWNQTAEFLHQGIISSDSFVAGRDLHAVAHSLGGMLSMLAQSRHPGLFKSMVLLDPIMFPPVLLTTMKVIDKFGLTSVFHPFVKPTLRRRNFWQDRQQAFEYFHKRKIFEDWTDESLESYVQYALKEDGAGVRLCCAPELEAKWFGTLPEKMWPAVKKLQGQVSIFMGQDTYPFSLRAGRHATKLNESIDLSVVTGGHCFMQENPQDAAGYVFAAVDRCKGSICSNAG